MSNQAPMRRFKNKRRAAKDSSDEYSESKDDESFDEEGSNYEDEEVVDFDQVKVSPRVRRKG
jgi:hypothetical protein